MNTLQEGGEVERLDSTADDEENEFKLHIAWTKDYNIYPMLQESSIYIYVIYIKIILKKKI